jgi:RNA polymerase primary sigma factor
MAFSTLAQINSPGSLLSRYLKEIGKFDPLSSAEEQELARRIRRGDAEALERLVKANLRFVVSVAHNYANQGLPIEDLITEGNIGLIRAAQRFDPTKNFRFISYAVWWIRQAILQALADGSRIVRVPVNQSGRLFQIHRVRDRLTQRYGRRPDLSEIAEELQGEESSARRTLEACPVTTSLDAPVGDGRSTGHELMADEESSNPEARVEEIMFREKVARLLERLAPREREVLRLYFGIGEDIPYTLEEIGIRLNLTRERVRQIKETGLKKLRVALRGTKATRRERS